MPANQSTPEVTQADREAAAVHPNLTDREREAIRAGHMDMHGYVQMLANSRTSSATPARGGDELRGALEQIAINSNRDWDQVSKHPAEQIDVIHTLAVDALYGAALASTDMAGAGEDAEIKRLRGLLIDPGTPPWEDARAVLVAELRKSGYSTHADNVEAAHGVLIPSDIALNLIAQAARPAPPGEGRTSERRDDYRGWQIEHNPPPIPTRAFDWIATHPSFDGEGDTRQVWGASWDAVRAEIDAWHEENAS